MYVAAMYGISFTPPVLNIAIRNLFSQLLGTVRVDDRSMDGSRLRPAISKGISMIRTTPCMTQCLWILGMSPLGPSRLRQPHRTPLWPGRHKAQQLKIGTKATTATVADDSRGQL